MPVPSDFHFSQNNLQDYVDCPRRFQLHYLRKVLWPAVQTEPVMEQEEHMRQGERFHQLVQQHQLGIGVEQLDETIRDPVLQAWWQSYLLQGPGNLPAQRYPEFTLTAPFAGYRLVAKYDLLAVEPGQKIIIVDWKTNRQAQKRDHLKQRLQTRLYRYLVVLAGMCLNKSQPINAEQVEMIYWFAALPEQPVHFRYTSEQLYQDQEYLHHLVSEIAAAGENDFPMTSQEKRCLYCTYRSLCGRGDRAGNWETSEEEPDEGLSAFDFDSIGEISF